MVYTTHKKDKYGDGGSYCFTNITLDISHENGLRYIIWAKKMLYNGISLNGYMNIYIYTHQKPYYTHKKKKKNIFSYHMLYHIMGGSFSLRISHPHPARKAGRFLCQQQPGVCRGVDGGVGVVFRQAHPCSDWR